MKASTKKVVSRTLTVIVAVVFGFVMVVFLTFIVQSVMGKKPNLFGYRVFNVVTDSMQPELMVNDVIISRIVADRNDAEQVKEGDIITFVAEYGTQKGMLITHRVVQGVHFDEMYQRYVVTTKGDNVRENDPPVPVENIEAVMVTSSGFLGAVYSFISSTTGLILLLGVPLGFMVAILVVRLVKIIRTPAEELDKQRNGISEQEQERRNQRIKEIAEQAVKEFIEKQNKEKE